MDIQTLKLNLVSKIINIEKTSLLIEINKILQKENKTDWWDKLPVEVQESIMEGMDDIQKGDVFTHEQVIQEAKQKYGFWYGSNLVGKSQNYIFFKVLDYLEKNWNKSEIIQFSRKTEIVIQAIQKNPGIFVFSSKHKNIWRAIVDKNNSFFYQVDKKNRRILLLTFFDNRQNPETLKFDSNENI